VACAGEGRRLACREARRILAEQGPAIDADCCAWALAPLRQRLAAGTAGGRAAGAAARADPRREPPWPGRAERAELEAECREAADRWAARWAEGLRRALAAGEAGRGGRRKRKADGGAAAGAGVRLGRFPRFVDALVGRAAELLEEAKAAMLADAAACADPLRAPASPPARARARPAAARPAAAAAEEAGRAARALAEGVLRAFPARGSVAGPLAGSLEAVAAGVGDPDWAEACAPERARVRGRLEQLAAAQRGIRRLLGEPGPGSDSESRGEPGPAARGAE
jgi:hypothetical protein